MSQAGTIRGARAVEMTTGGIILPVLRYTLPLIVGNLFQLLYNLVDSLVVGNVEGADALAAVGSTAHPLQLVLGMFLGVGLGANILVSQYFGQKDFAAIGRVARTATTFITLCAIPLTGAALLAGVPLLHFMKIPAEIFEMTYLYLAISCLGAVAMLGYNLNAGILRGMGNSKSPLYFLMWASLLNIALDLLFIVTLRWGVAGAAAATTLSQFVSWGLSILHLRRHYPQFGKGFTLRLDRETRPLLWHILRLGFPLGMMNSMNSMGHIFFKGAVNVYGAAYIAGYVASSKIDSIQFFILASFGTAVTAFTGQNFGARQYERMKRGLGSIMGMALVLNVVGGALILLWGRPLIRLFNRTPQVVEAGYNVFLWLLPFYWIYVIFYILNQYLNGLGTVRVATLSNLFMFWAVRVPCAYLFSHLWGKDFLFMAYPVSWLMGLAFTGSYYIWFRRNKLPELTGQDARQQ